MSLRSNPDRLSIWHVLILAGAAIISLGVYLLVSRLYYGNGFPLDDAWIHQTYARNLATHGEWAFLPGTPSAGSTAPLWSALLAVGFVLHLGLYIWTYSLGALLLWGLALVSERELRTIIPGYRPRIPWAGCLVALEWHLVWAAGSGMETLLSALLALLVLVRLFKEKKTGFLAGILIGLAIWVRPDGITLLGPVLFCVLLVERSWKRRMSAIGSVLIGFGCLLALYLFFNLRLAGTPWPNTFYAKQEEYASYLAQPFLIRLAREPLQLITGVGAILLPGFILKFVAAVRKREWGILATGIWILGFIGLYAWRLPVTYQYGRYIMPVMPAYFFLGLAGLIEFMMKKERRWMLAGGWNLAAWLILVIFWFRGGTIYARDVAIIESEMVATARWVAVNLPDDALVAAHDIGALGYFGEHELVDLAGLISPEVIPYIHDETQLTTYLDERQVDYLVTFPDWYPDLVYGRECIFSTGAPYAPAMGATNMAVYLWKQP